MMKYDKLVWLEKYGIFISNIWASPIDDFCVTWEAHGGLTITGTGDTAEEMYDNLYTTIKGNLLTLCLR